MSNPYQDLGASALEGGEWIEVDYESPRSPVKQSRSGVVIDAFSHPWDEQDIHKVWFREDVDTGALFELVFGNDTHDTLKKSSASVKSEATGEYVPPADADVETRWTRLNDPEKELVVTIEPRA